MPIPKAAPGEEYAYDFQYAVFVREPEMSAFFLDSYLVEPLHAPFVSEEDVFVSLADLERIYAPYLSAEKRGEMLTLSCLSPRMGTRSVSVGPEVWTEKDGVCYVPVAAVMGGGFGRKTMNRMGLVVVAVDGTDDPEKEYASFRTVKRYRDRLHQKRFGEMNFTMWMEEAKRLIPYRMYIPSCYHPEQPNPVLVCFHGGDANPDYMFKHTNNEIEIYAEKEGMILLALCSYRKFTFFGGSKLPAGADLPCGADPAARNPAGLTEEELEWCRIAEESVPLQIGDAGKRYAFDPDRMYALGNSGGCIGIFDQVRTLPARFFRAAVCSGGCPQAEYVGAEELAAKGTRFLFLQGSEDELDGQYSFFGAYPYLKSHGLDITYRAVGGGSHLLGWTRALDQVFEFLRES